MSLFITFEGGEGCGKSFQSRFLYRKLIQTKTPAILTYEPGGTPLGNHIRVLLKKRKYDMSPIAELFLFLASRAQLTNDVIIPALRQDKVVICDRYADSTVVYQGFARGLDLHSINLLNQISTQGLHPDMTILLDMPVEEGLRRKKGKLSDRFDSEDMVFHRKVREGFLTLAKQNDRNWLIVDARLSRNKIAAIIWEKVLSLLSGR